MRTKDWEVGGDTESYSGIATEAFAFNNHLPDMH